MLRFKVANMSCGGCARAVTAALRGVDPAAGIAVDLDRREVAVESEGSAGSWLPTASSRARPAKPSKVPPSSFSRRAIAARTAGLTRAGGSPPTAGRTASPRRPPADPLDLNVASGS